MRQMRELAEAQAALFRIGSDDEELVLTKSHHSARDKAVNR